MSTSVDSRVEPNPTRIMELCDFCMELVQAISGPDMDPFWYDLVRPIRSACEFCKELTERFTSAALPKKYTPKTVGQLRLGCSKSAMHNEVNLRCRLTIRHGDNDLSFAVWADKGTPACKRFVTRPPILGPNTEDAHSLARQWLTECILSHATCVSTKRETLPTRVLKISGNGEAPRVRLVETEGKTATRYCALSHCWGSVDKQPLRTTRSNYPCHIRGIMHGQLPKSFQDAILLTRSLNIDYLWIDSLCIIQDNEDDWRFEAGKMADVYRNATLVIAASDAEDSTGGLFITDRKHEPIMVVPYIAEGMVQGSFNIAQLPVDKSKPSEGHLNTRAWAFQERLLARRSVFFMRGGISWKCSDQEIGERGADHDLGFYEELSWISLLTEYSEKKLTNAGDRLFALQGVIEELRDTRGDHYHDSYGVWDSDIYKQLLWRQDKPPLEAEALKLPTWTWAATGGTKMWSSRFSGQGAITSMPQVLQISSSGALLSSGHISQDLPTLSSRTLPRNNVHDYVFPEWIMLTEHKHNGRQTHLIENSSFILGLAVFDREPSRTAVCFFVAWNDRHERKESEGGKPGHAHDEDGHHDTTLIGGDISGSGCTTGVQPSAAEATARHSTLSSVLERETDTRRAIHVSDIIMSEDDDSDERGSEERDSEGNYNDESGIEEEYSEGEYSDEADSEGLCSEDRVIFDEIVNLSETTDFVYWCLLLEPAGEGKYTRVGLAMLYPHAFKALDPKLADFEII